ncbi:class C beta-lactamase-related serine hydrolase [Nocardia panacis]|uniref:Class C beta-lactamase-related serine hydrolase n=1 Tax=Nocardia panacis TaxID=2340916 RepID=A0A3A4KE38_9NOCA|nr:serine hydrolase [Nocardia panacis]RJO73755.1 class C beta-lactamase-related serine hydrolase [Nocardia panacis]
MTRTKPGINGIGLFTGIAQHENFGRMPSLADSVRMAPAPKPYEFPSAPMRLPDTYTYDDSRRPVANLLVETETAALLVLVDGVIVSEQYWLSGGVDVPWLSMSVAKSAVSMLVGMAVADGAIRDIGDPISDYVQVRPGSAYDGVSIKAVLQMSSGARWNEDYSDPDSDVRRLGAAMSGESTLDDMVANMVREHAPNTLCRYNSGDTQALGSLVVAATGRTLADYMSEKLCAPLGMSAPGYWLTDTDGREMAYGGLNLTARDYAKLGELARRCGDWHGTQLIPASWMRESVTPDAPHLQPGHPVVGNHALPTGYGYQWWIPDADRGDFCAIGVYNQFIYVDPVAAVTVVKLSANRAYGTSPTEAASREEETVAFLRSIGHHFRTR